MNKNLLARLGQSRAVKRALVVGLTLGASAAFADDTSATAATTAISSAQAAALSVVGALVGMKIAVWGAGYLGKFFNRS